MKIIGIPDTHGKDLWKNALDSDFDKLVFLGDYWDAFYIGYSAQKKNFEEILELKRTYPEKVVLLFGNHDYHYLRGHRDRYSGYQRDNASEIQVLIEEALPLFQAVYIHDKTIFSHAGITNTWLKNKASSVEDVNDLFKEKKSYFGFLPGVSNNRFGDDITQGPFWVRPDSLIHDGVKDYNQIVGHTCMGNINSVKAGSSQYIFCDTLDTSMEAICLDTDNSDTHTTISLKGDTI